MEDNIRWMGQNTCILIAILIEDASNLLRLIYTMIRVCQLIWSKQQINYWSNLAENPDIIMTSRFIDKLFLYREAVKNLGRLGVGGTNFFITQQFKKV